MDLRGSSVGPCRCVQSPRSCRASFPQCRFRGIVERVLLVYRGRFAYVQRNGAACTWGYGTWQTQGNRVQWRFVDGGGTAPSSANTKPGEVHDLT